MQRILPRLEYYTAADGRRLAVRVWEAFESPRGRVVFLHGITSHGGWYIESCRHLACAGLEVHFLDRRGSGLNGDQPGDVDVWQTWVDDVAVYLQQLKQSPAHPAHGGQNRAPALCGISWGGKLATAVARQQPGLVGGLGLICPGLFSHHEPNVVKKLVLRVSRPLRIDERRVAIPLDDPALFIEHAERREFIARDPLALRQITIRFAREDQRLTQYARRAAPYLHLPLVLMLAGRDRIVANRPTRRFFAQAPSPNKTLIEYTNATHTLEFESEPGEYFADLTSWLARTLNRKCRLP